MDWNNDGYTDIIVGDRSGFINFFERNSDGSLKAGVKLQSGGTTIDAGANSSPDFVDWDNDGDLDMLVGVDGSHHLRLYMNTGTASSYQFSGYTDFTAGGGTPTHYRSMPSIYDMNGDGLFDVIVGANDKKFHYYENTGTAGSPSFAADNPLQYQGGGTIYTDHSDCRLDLNDWNEDGYPDLIAGDYDDYVYLYMAYDGVSVEENAFGLQVPSSLQLTENPVQSNLSVSVNLGTSAKAFFNVFTVDGRVIVTHSTGQLASGYNTVTIPENLPNGAYILRCTVGNRSFTERFTVVR